MTCILRKARTMRKRDHGIHVWEQTKLVKEKASAVNSMEDILKDLRNVWRSIGIAIFVVIN